MLISKIYRENYNYSDQPKFTLKPFLKTLIKFLTIFSLNSILFFQGVYFCDMRPRILCMTERQKAMTKAIIKLIIFNLVMWIYFFVAAKIAFFKLLSTFFGGNSNDKLNSKMNKFSHTSKMFELPENELVSINTTNKKCDLDSIDDVFEEKNTGRVENKDEK